MTDADICTCCHRLATAAENLRRPRHRRSPAEVVVAVPFTARRVAGGVPAFFFWRVFPRVSALFFSRSLKKKKNLSLSTFLNTVMYRTKAAPNSPLSSPLPV